MEDGTFNINKLLSNKTLEYRIIVFFVNVLDFSKVLKLVESFVDNPKLVYDTYNDIMEQKKIVFTNKDLNHGLTQDKKLDEPVGKIKKLVKILTNND